MRKLTSYLTRLFAVDALVLFGIVCVLLWLVNCLRSFEVVSVKGQGFGTLAVQALYTMPPLALSFFYICVGIGMVRALTALQNSHELHIIHTSHGLPGLWRAVLATTSAAALGALLLAHVAEPMANRQLNVLSAAIAADLVSSTLKPNRFTQATPGVVMLIGGREDGGSITEFFADDRRDPDMRRTYIAQSARVMALGDDFILELHDGTLQYVGADGRYSEIRFARYDINVESLSQPGLRVDPLTEKHSFELVGEALASGEWPARTVQHLLDRSAEALRVIGLCLFVLAIAGFPSGRRTRIRLPLEAVVMVVAFVERGIGSYSPLGTGTGAILLIGLSALILAIRLWPRRPIVEAPA
ncbi:LptF/LptG family permease [Devosia sp. YIM 151766]|uniref:LptF/LptG family permease n=1 Tax=Devosia sp. YIM 151766 TaxID=3017325 RepID=UPI00255C478E|nr:LptF/LptG family permease [Devosia sp. YIM 151766]WIY53823.1 LptF/LptG family permease [Devosia sp. YIM 151766]